MRYLQYLFFLLILIVFAHCSSTKYVPDGHFMVNKVSLYSDNKNIKTVDARPFVKQEPTHKTFNLIPFPLYLYNLSGRDSSKWINRFLKRAGSAPEIYDEQATHRTKNEITKMLINKGYNHGHVIVDTVIHNKKIDISYFLATDEPLTINQFSYSVKDDSIRSIILLDSVNTLIHPNNPLDRDVLEKERVRITSQIRNKGYWNFNKEFINYTADTTKNSTEVSLTLNLISSIPNDSIHDIQKKYKPYRIGKVFFYPDYDPISESVIKNVIDDTLSYKGYQILYRTRRYIKPETLVENCFIRPGMLYSDRSVDATYNALARLQILKYINIRFELSQEDPSIINCRVLLTPGKDQSLQTELEGTNSAGDLGFAAAVIYQHRNIFKGSETFSAKVRGGYENMTGNVSEIVRDNYAELGAELGLLFPKFLFPMLSTEKKRRIRASTEFKVSYDYQHRPEYERVIAGAGWKYNWMSNYNKYRHTLDFIDLSYVYLPYRSEAFIDSIINKNPITYSSYKDHLITRTGYTFYYSNLKSLLRTQDVFTLRLNTEVAGNVLCGISHLINQKKINNAYEIAGLRYEQYWKFDIDYAYTKVITPRNALAFHLATGVGVPYGNSSVLPFEKRYYSGGANSVRGWSVRTLGPGKYKSDNPDFDYFNQCGDIRFDASMEYRTRLFWKLELAAFLDAGNVWTIRDYESQPGGVFKIDEFYKQIALGWGLGIRFDFNYFILRLDLGFKAYDPAKVDTTPWVLTSPFKSSNRTLHFAVGYPF